MSDTSGTTFTYRVRANDNTVDNVINVYINENSVSDNAGNTNTISNQYSFTINAFVSPIKTTTELVTDINDISGIAEDEKLSTTDIDLVLSTASTITDDTDPFDTSDDTETTEETTTGNEVLDSVFKIELPISVEIKNPKVFKALVEQIFSIAEDVTTLKIDKTSMALSEEATTQFAEVEEIVMVKTNQLDPVDLSTFTNTNSGTTAAYIPLTNINDFTILNIEGNNYTSLLSAEDTYTLSKDDVEVTGSPYTTNDVYVISDTFKLVFGSVGAIGTEEDDTSDNDTSDNDTSDNDTSDNATTSDSSSSIIPCFLENTNILTTKGYKKIQDINPKKDILVDHMGNKMKCLEIKSYIEYSKDGNYPRKIPKGSKLSDNIICNEDLYLTYNHCIYNPNNDKFIPTHCMKNIKPSLQERDKYIYYHIFTDNYFCDTVIANGIPCETHSKYIFKYLNNLDPTNNLLFKMISKVNMKPNCERDRITRKQFKNLVKKYKQKKNKNKSIL